MSDFPMLTAKRAGDNALQLMLDRQSWILADGATGTSLLDAGLPPGEAPERWNLDRPEEVLKLARGFVEAGAQLLLTNSFGGNRLRLRLHRLDGRVEDVNRRAAEIAREAAAVTGALVAGSMGPTGELLEPLGDLAQSQATQVFEEQGEALIEGGVDLLWGETLSAREEINAFLDAMARLSFPYVVTLSFDTAGRTMMGLGPADLLDLIASRAQPPVAFGANCGTGASDLLASLLELGGSSQPLVAKANAGVPSLRGGEVHYTGTPEVMGRFALLARDAGARIIGGCCGTTSSHLTEMRLALENAPPGPRPDRDSIERETGSFVQRLPGRPAGSRRRSRGAFQLNRVK